MGEEDRPRQEEATDVEGAADVEPSQEQAGAGQQGQQGQRVRLNFDGVKPQYANFCTLTARQGEVFLSFGNAFAPEEELQVDTQIVMSMRNVQQLYQAMGRLLQQQEQQEQQSP